MAPRRGARAIPRKRPTQERATITVDALVTAVELVLERHGLDGLTTNRVAEVAGVSVGSLYQYFHNKEALVGAVIERYLGRAVALCRAALADAGGLPLDAVVARTAGALVAAHASLRPIHRWLVELRGAAETHAGFRRTLDAMVDDVAAFLAARPDLRVPDVRAAAFVLVHAVEGVVAATGAREGEADVAAVARHTARMVLAFLEANRT